MGNSPGPRASWRGSWPGALLAASILSSCFLPTEGQDTSLQILQQPQYPVVGQDVTLTPSPAGTVEKAIICRWFRQPADEDKLIFSYSFTINTGKTGPAYTNRETRGSGCSLHIRNLRPEDTGNYSVSLSGPLLPSTKAQASMTVSDAAKSDGLSGGAIAGIVIGTLAGTALIVGTFLYFLTRARAWRDKAPTPTTAAPSVDKNVSPPGQGRPGVKIEDFTDASHIYQTLQHADQSIYQQLEGSRQASRPSALS